MMLDDYETKQEKSPRWGLLLRNYGGLGMNRFIALIMTLTAVWILFAIAYDDLSGWFVILSFLLFVIAPNITDE